MPDSMKVSDFAACRSAANLLRAQDLQRPPSTSPSLLKCIGVGIKLLGKIRATLQICC